MSLSWLGKWDVGRKSLGSSSWEVASFRVGVSCPHPCPFGGLVFPSRSLGYQSSRGGALPGRVNSTGPALLESHFSLTLHRFGKSGEGARTLKLIPIPRPQQSLPRAHIWAHVLLSAGVRPVLSQPAACGGERGLFRGSGASQIPWELGQVGSDANLWLLVRAGLISECLCSLA